MISKKNISKTVKAAHAADESARTADRKNATTVDSFVNFSMNLGVGADNALSSSSY